MREETRRVLLLAPALIVAALVGGIVAGQAATGAQVGLLALPVVIVGPVAFWKWPRSAPLTLLVGGILIEGERVMVGTRDDLFTDRIPLFRTLTHGTIILPAEALVVVALMVWLMKCGLRRSFQLPHSPVGRALLGFWALLIVGFGVGMSHGARFNIALWEIRPWIFLSVSYLLAAAWLTTRSAIQALMWAFVLGTGFKALQGIFIFFSYARHLDPRPEAILSHDESFFFGFYILLTLGLWLYGQRGRLRVTATVLLPFVVEADLANSRRTAWPVLIVGLAVLLASSWFGLPDRRRMIRVIVASLCLGSAIYLPLYWHKDGSLAQPARAVRSAFGYKDPRDTASDTYRQQEDANLIYNIRASGKLGRGFGVPINYALPITDISNIDPMITYIPHNGLLWIWMRLGLQGEIAFWLVIGAATIRASRLARSRDKQLALLGALTACAIVAYVIQGYNDLGLDSFRIAIALGCLLGCVEAASRLAPVDASGMFEAADGEPGADESTPSAGESPVPWVPNRQPALRPKRDLTSISPTAPSEDH